MTTCRPIEFLRHSDLIAISDAVSQRVGSWRGDWVSSGDVPVSVTSEAIGAHQELPEVWHEDARVAQTREGTIAIRAADEADLAGLLVGAPSGAETRAISWLERELLDAALADLGARFGINGSAAAPWDQPGLRAFTPSGGAGTAGVVSRISLGAVNLELALSLEVLHGFWQRSVRPLTGAVSLSSVGRVVSISERVGTCLSVCLGEGELTVDELRSLDVGDVISLDARIGTPLDVRIGDSGQSVQAFLGLKEGAPALQIAGAVRADA